MKSVETAADLIQRLHNIDWFQFEKVVALTYRKLGYTVMNRGGANPDGVLPWKSQLPSSISTAILCLAFVLQGCAGRGPEGAAASTQVGRANETWAFWNSLNQAAVTGDGIEVLQKSSWQGKLSDEDMANVFRDIISQEQERCKTIESLPVLHVDPDLAAYAVQFVHARADIANFLNDGAKALDQEKAIASGSDFAVGFGLQLLRHHNDDDGMVWNAFMDQAAQTANDVQQMKPVAANLQDRAASVRAGNASLKAEEMRVRIKLSQRFNREFPPVESYVISKPHVKMEPFSQNQVLRDMIGWRIDGWTFASPEEFVSLRITGVASPSEVETDYEVETHVKGRFSGAEHNFRLRLTYEKMFTRWKLTNIQLVN
jgi:hypothetical protein